jgi:signal transduction histidine kinase
MLCVGQKSLTFEKFLFEMKQKINLLILFSAVVLVALSAMQFYLVKTAYDYKTEQFREEIKNKIAQVTRDYSTVDSTFYYEKDQAYKELAENYITNKTARVALQQLLAQNKFRKELSSKLQAKFDNEMPGLQLDFAVVLNKFVIYDANKTADTIFAEKTAIANKMYGRLASLDNAFLIRNYVGTTSGKVQNGTIVSDYKLLTEDTLYVSIPNWQWIILRRMAMIFFFAVFSIATLITLFIVALRALIRQKKVSDVKTDFINNITHELKTPLTTLSVSAKILEKPEIRNNDEMFRTVLGTMDRQNKRLQNLIDQVMSNSLGHAEIELRKEPIETQSFLLSIINDFKIAYPDINIEENLEANTTLPVDKFHLTTAVNNVLENAVKYGCRTIVVKTNLNRSLFCLSIHDDGIGIAKSKQVLLFDKFYRIAEGNLHTTKGLGLGLYYVDQIIRAHKGSIAVASELGRGASFTISIPAVS